MAGFAFVASVAVVLAFGVIVGARVAAARERLDALLAAHWRNEDICAAAELAADGDPCPGVIGVAS